MIVLGFQPDINAVITPELDVIMAFFPGDQTRILTNEIEVECLLRPVDRYFRCPHGLLQ